MFEYLKRVFGSMTGGLASSARSSASSRKARRCCQNEASTPSRTTPELCERSWAIVVWPVAASRPWTCRLTGSSRCSLPASCSLKIPAAVKVFECEATRKRCRGVSASPVSRSATPKARSRTRAPPGDDGQDAAREAPSPASDSRARIRRSGRRRRANRASVGLAGWRSVMASVRRRGTRPRVRDQSGSVRGQSWRRPRKRSGSGCETGTRSAGARDREGRPARRACSARRSRSIDGTAASSAFV